MNVAMNNGRYVIGVSGGVDSMSLLDILCRQPGVELIVGHFNHGIRHDCAKDEALVKKITQKHRLNLEIGRGKLGIGASEETARNARYDFLRELKKKHKAQAIITAHHQDDMIETALLNVIRGTGRRGLVSIIANPQIARPLLSTPKTEIVAYAKAQNLEWREDSSNTDEKYARNHLRQLITARLTSQNRREILNNIEKVAKLDTLLNDQIATISRDITNKGAINRQKFVALSDTIGRELVMFWLNDLKVPEISRKIVQQITLAIKAAHVGSKFPISRDINLFVSRNTACFETNA